MMKKIFTKYKNIHHNRHSGFGLVEIIIGTSIISMSLVGIVTAFNLFMRTGLANTEKIQATYILEESIEAFRYIRDSGWATNINTLSVDVPYNLVFDNSNWEATTTGSLIDNLFDRTVTLTDVYRRDSDNDIVASTSLDSKTLDPNIKQITAKVAWDGKEVNATTYFANIFSN